VFNLQVNRCVSVRLFSEPLTSCSQRRVTDDSIVQMRRANEGEVVASSAAYQCYLGYLTVAAAAAAATLPARA